MSRSFLSTPIEYLKGVGPQKADLLKLELKVFTYQDLIEQAVAAEREACAKVCDELQQQWRPAAECADVIRARGNRT